MSQSPRVPPEEFVESMRDDLDRYAKEIMEAVNQAANGEWISGSKERVRDLSAEMRQRIFERAMQKRIDAAEAVFPLSAPSDDGQAAGE